MLTLIHGPVAAPDETLPEIALRAERGAVVKRIWRGRAEDGAEFGFELAAPLADGATVFQSATARYVLRQDPEPVLEIPLDLPPSAAAGVGWAIGNLHLSLAAEPERLLTADEPATRALLERLRVPFRATCAVFRPGRFARGHQSPHELGPSHRH
ncbi:urease accessory protein UreE [Opitutus terrae]|uniref:UreE urease accessory domain protein n=1 Tax=Opitutus terrae (strain DSM 11246 / JCM 15787 / PB90-1) TaxID=452637 RepID=B1ZNZ9_OPITP|nr:urease accessory protein UreE [Opitutus terrae]ACB77488.1 UreE urease accessory domain protein [Opitutus terrae PB90-1]